MSDPFYSTAKSSQITNIPATSESSSQNLVNIPGSGQIQVPLKK